MRFTVRKEETMIKTHQSIPMKTFLYAIPFKMYEKEMFQGGGKGPGDSNK